MNNYYDQYQVPDFYAERQKNKSEIKKLGFYTGLALILQIIIQNVLSLALDKIGFMDSYGTDGAYQNAVDILLVIVGLLVPFYFIGKRMKAVSKISYPISLNKPCDKGSFILAVISGIGFCMLAGIVTSYFTIIISFFGIELSAPDIPMPRGTLGIITTFLRVVVLAAVSEEICLRGYVMGNLRKYGDKFAIIISATVFAIIHGNLIQAPFALIAGFAIGYFTVKTGSIWTGIAIHAANNLISTVVSYCMDYFGEEKVSMVYVFILYGFVIVGFIAVKAFNKRGKNYMLYEDSLVLTTGEKMKAFFINPAMIVAMGYMLYITSLFIGFKF